MSIDEIFQEAKASLTALRSSNGEITPEQNIFACAQLEAIRLKIHAMNSRPINKVMPIAADFLKAGIEHMQDRAVTYDKPEGERSMAKTIASFNIMTDSNHPEEHGWLFMGLLKKSRSLQGDYRADNYEDDAAYAGLRGEAAARERSK